ncbi:paraquat-inducible protein A [Collimonas pratensis]|uniref:Paraquat-inducible A family protein n=1 Tax=Collimonas pratensis TaxID=279113 RepID=A0ABN4MDY8_9BURK|nr:paraquat-inducible protein A [Collimonas pratensis]AMP14734.1 paraquat-inducible A family protein [Collimonas pratensis]
MREVPDLIACEGCDALYRKVQLRRGEIAHCPRCGTELDRDDGRQRERILPLTVASLIMFLIANSFPIVEIELQGLRSQTTLFGAVLSLSAEGMSLVAMLVLATTILFPLLQLLFLLYLLLTLRNQQRPPGFRWLVHAMQNLRPWGMVEVFLLGVLVAVVKLSNMATVIPGVALWAFGVLTVLLTAVVSFNPRRFWQMAFADSSPQESP